MVWGEAQFTSRARDMIAAGEYRYGSPALDWGARDKGTGDPQGLTLTSFALTNTPVLDRMPAIRLSDAYRKEDEGERTNMSTQAIGVKAELDQIGAIWKKMAQALMDEGSVSLSEAYKRVAREDPAMFRRRNELTRMAWRG